MTRDDVPGAASGGRDRLERLWTPYRLAYIQSDEREKNPDPFMSIPDMSDEDGLIVARGDSVYAVMNKFPYNPGHLLIVPYRKVAQFEDVTATELAELMDFARAAVKVIKLVSNPDAMNIGFNIGRASGGSVGDHLHLHIVPRWIGDANFMTVIDATKVLAQALGQTRHLLASEWASHDWAPGTAIPGDMPTYGVGESSSGDVDA